MQPENPSSRAANLAVSATSARRLPLALGLLLSISPATRAQTIRVDITSGHARNSFSPLRALGAALDKVPQGEVEKIYADANQDQMLGSGWGALSYRLYTELSVQDWHWNPVGNWSDPSGQGYWTGATNSPGQIVHSYGYRLPHRGFTEDTTGGTDYSCLTDGDPKTYWKSNPYLAQAFTGEDDALFPQWAVLDLKTRQNVDAVRVVWADPYATAYQVQYWSGSNAFREPAKGEWKTFPKGVMTGAQGGAVTLRLSPKPIPVRWVRVLMTASSNTCDTHGSTDRRNCEGFAIAEVGVGRLASDGRFNDLVTHAPDNKRQTATRVSSVDPWHTAQDQGKLLEQPGLDLILSSRLTRGLPVMVPVSILYGVPEDAAAEIAYLKGRGYAISHVEMGEEPDGQFMQPEHYAALYIQWARALHAVDPTLKLGGPVFEGGTRDVQHWPDSRGNTSWLTRFIDYLRQRGRLGDLSFLSFEHYPFEPCEITWNRLLDEPALVQGIVKAYAVDGLPPGTPMFITEYNVSWANTQAFQELFGALWNADFLGSFLTSGGSGTNYFHYIPTPLRAGGRCNTGGSFGMFAADRSYRIRARTSQFFSTQLVTQEWAQPVDAPHQVYPAASDLAAPGGKLLLTAYALHRPDGQWALLLINKDDIHAHSLSVSFHDSSDNSDHSFADPVTRVTFGSRNYRWHASGDKGYADPDGPPVTTSVAGGPGAAYTVPEASITVLRGNVR